jgi:hypothetical protein
MKRNRTCKKILRFLFPRFSVSSFLSLALGLGVPLALSSRVKRSGREAEHTPPSNAEVYT